ncbi:hypothetical protein Cni_G28221 [Canna indica]|uniref:VQ domain-containing protein n=1 Tax=Canna indica TaxID=4628 RepID=A0AAQ3QS43_9LILI|nr:hypothetical protein Cni_G28221 [Canna indica]
MDSANSSSLQSSSGGDDEFDSRVDSLSAFFHSSTAASAAALPASQPPPLISSSAADGAHHLFDYSYLDSSTPLLPLDSAVHAAVTAPPWPRTLIPSSSNCTVAAASFGIHPAAAIQYSSSVQPPAEKPSAAAAAPRSSKKRSRASRRAPTTVLTTDTSNFRAMVQEFTGIPSPPFAAAAASASPFVRSRLDLFHSVGAFRSSSADAAPPPFLLRPFPQKVQSSPPFTSMFTNPTSSSPPPLTVTNTINATTNSPTDNTNYRIPSHELSHGGLQSFLQPSLLLQPNYTQHNMAASFNAKQHIVPSDGYSENELGRLPHPVLTGSGAARSSWTSGGADLSQLRPGIVGDYSTGSQLRIGSSCRPNYSAPGTAEFNTEKPPEGTRGEGMVESWIHSSD